MAYDDDVEESKVLSLKPAATQPQQSNDKKQKKDEATLDQLVAAQEGGEDSDFDDDGDIQMLIERQSSAKEDTPIDYLQMNGEPKKVRQVTQVD